MTARMPEPRPYEPTLESVHWHPLPDWYQDAKLGIFVQWGLYSVPGWAASRKSPYQTIMESGFETYFRENPYAEWYLNTLKFEVGPTRAYHDRTYGADFAYEDFQPIFERLRKEPNDTLLSDMVNRVIPEWGRTLTDNEPPRFNSFSSSKYNASVIPYALPQIAVVKRSGCW